jgi:hypothetical protein
MTLIKSSGKGKRLNGWEKFSIKIYQQEGLLNEAQNIPDLNPV